LEVSPFVVLPTLPAMAGLSDAVADRGPLLAGLTFMEGSAAGWTAADLCAWFVDHAALLGRVEPPPAVSDAALGLFPLQRPPSSEADPSAPDLSPLLSTVRRRVASTLRGLTAQPSDDRFLQAAIFSGRVSRERRGKASIWAACARDADHLSDIVLSLFVVDILSYREFYEQNLCACEVCGRLSFNPSATPRAGCADHTPSRDGAGQGAERSASRTED
jgi:hypothetical protein